MSPDRLPYAGPLNRVGGPISIITGLSKWGFTLGVAAAEAVTQRICGENRSPFSAMISTGRVPDLPAVKQLVGSQAQVGLAATTGWAKAVASTLA